MQRRTFLTLAGGLLAGAALQPLLPSERAVAATWTRAVAWKPNASPTLALEWRYIAGRVTTETEDYGFIISIGEHKLPTPFKELLVQRQDFKTGAFLGNSYTGTLSYDIPTATYTFKNASNSATATIQLDVPAQLYRLTLNSPELSLSNVVLRPQGSLIPETGDGLLSVGQVQGFQVESDYYADWTEIEIGAQVVGVARVDMQGLRVAGFRAAAPAATASDYDHHWFALAGSLATSDGLQPVWISAWRIVSAGATYWDVTIATGTGSWATVFKTEADTAAMAEPLTVRELAWQPVPALAGVAGPNTTGAAWRLSAGVGAPGDLLDLTISVPPGQFAGSARYGGSGSTGFLEEGVGVSATGTIGGKPLSNLRLAVAESTAEFALAYLPLMRH